jgi:lipoprotein-anchoring transpeptidase ErfK/SrfK
MESTRVSGRRVSLVGERLWQLAVLAAIGTLGVTSQAEAIYYWQDSATPAVTQPAPKQPERRTKTSRRGDKKSDVAVAKESKPQGPLIISISIAQQKLRLYDSNGLFAEAPVSTGMPGHPTPMGVFSVIQKQKLHHSNIYSGAPMPFMQRITWSGVAMHAGVLPGHPASHGCIRMPMAFAVKLYNWTRMGARVIVTPGDVTPENFSHPLLATVKVVPDPVAVEETKSDAVAVKAPERQADAAAAVTETKIELRPTVGHSDGMKSAADGSRPAPSPLTQTADASAALQTGVSDAAPLREAASRPAEAAASDHEDAPKAAAEAEAAKSEADPNSMKHDEAAASDEKPASETSTEAQPNQIADNDARPADTARAQPAKPEAETATVTNEAATPSDNATASAPNTPTAETPKAKMESNALPQKPADTAQAPALPSSAPLKADLKSDFAKAAGPAFAFKKAGQIAVFVSRKDSKLYIRQDFSPLFDIPVTIAADARPLGTHIFTAQIDSHDANVLHWSVVSLPAPGKSTERRTEEERSSHGRKFASVGPVEAKPLPVPDTPAEALDRLKLPVEVMAKIYEAVSTGGSIIVSDQGIAAGETGEGTDFIVSLR